MPLDQVIDQINSNGPHWAENKMLISSQVKMNSSALLFIGLNVSKAKDWKEYWGSIVLDPQTQSLGLYDIRKDRKVTGCTS